MTRPSALDKELFNDLYKMYVEDENHLGIYEYFSRVNPASYQSMTAVLLESARKGYWKATQEQLEKTAGLHAKMTTEQGAACTEFVCGNDKLRSYVANQLELCPGHEEHVGEERRERGRPERAKDGSRAAAQEEPAERHHHRCIGLRGIRGVGFSHSQKE